MALNITRAISEIYYNISLDTVPLTSHSNNIKFGCRIAQCGAVQQGLLSCNKAILQLIDVM